MATGISHGLALLVASSEISIAAVNEDQEEETESFMSVMEIEDGETKTKGHYLHKPTSPNKSTKINHKQLKENLKKASADIVVGNTQNKY